MSDVKQFALVPEEDKAPANSAAVISLATIGIGIMALTIGMFLLSGLPLALITFGGVTLVLGIIFGYSS